MNPKYGSHRSRSWSWFKRFMIGLAALLPVLVVLTGIAGRSAKASLLQENPAPGQLVDVGGYRMHLHCIGQGTPTVVLDAGLNDFSVQWSSVQPEVAKFTQACTYDRAGLGWSEPSPYPRTSETIVKELHTLLENGNIAGPYVMVGHSFGGMNVRLYAHNYPEDVLGLVLVDSAHEEQTNRVPALRHAAQQVIEQFNDLKSLSSIGFMAFSPEQIPNRGLSDKSLAQYRAILATTRYFETAVAETEALEQSFTEVRAAKIVDLGDLPLIVLSRGLNDTIPGFSVVENQRYDRAWERMQSELVVLSSTGKQIIAEDSGHYIQLDQPDLVIEAIRELVQLNPG